MKVKCDFCKTEYNLDRLPVTPVQCAICGHSWRVAAPVRKNVWLMFFASVCALLSAVIFAVAVITHHNASHASRGPLIATVSSVDSVVDESGASHIVVSGTITNVSDAIYGVPDLIIVMSDDHGNILARQKFMPSATLLDSGASVEFKHQLSTFPSGVKRVSATLAEFEIPPQDKK